MAVIVVCHIYEVAGETQWWQQLHKVVEDPLMLGRMDGVQIGPGFEPALLAKISQTAK